MLPNGLRNDDRAPVGGLNNMTELPMHSGLVEEAHEFLTPLHLGFNIWSAALTDAFLQCLRCACQAIDQHGRHQVL